jgi:anti-sigma B factor antagonist
MEVSMSLVLTTHEVHGLLVMDMSGRLTILDENLRAVVLQLLQAGHRHFVLKMTEISYIDSCGLGQLVSIYISVRNQGGTVRMLMPSQRVRELLKITKLDTVFEIIEDEAQITALGANVARRP